MFLVSKINIVMLWTVGSMQVTEQVEQASPPYFPISPEQVRGEGDGKRISFTTLYFPPTRTAKPIAYEGSRVRTICAGLLILLTPIHYTETGKKILAG